MGRFDGFHRRVGARGPPRLVWQLSANKRRCRAVAWLERRRPAQYAIDDGTDGGLGLAGALFARRGTLPSRAFHSTGGRRNARLSSGPGWGAPAHPAEAALSGGARP